MMTLWRHGAGEEVQLALVDDDELHAVDGGKNLVSCVKGLQVRPKNEICIPCLSSLWNFVSTASTLSGTTDPRHILLR